MFVIILRLSLVDHIFPIPGTKIHLNGKLVKLFHRQLLRAGWGSVRSQAQHTWDTGLSSSTEKLIGAKAL